ncbi:Uncharacterized protein dnm_067890 [Desulfonema magnum]|uniref:Uncharacterized protein n=1 Tax=Desulfonema magnum TaxID=45655 RepID=A0A975BSD3_9BACT|nr:Uncharacterized protein dnm_067890 [Desulfonema magnum]
MKVRFFPYTASENFCQIILISATFAKNAVNCLRNSAGLFSYQRHISGTLQNRLYSFVGLFILTSER